MAKKYFLKKAFLKNFIFTYLIRGILSLVKYQFPKGDKTLVLLINGLGDIIVTDKLSRKVQEKYGKENVYFLIRKQNKDIAEILGYNTITLNKGKNYKFFERLKKMYDINMMGFARVLNFDGTSDSTIANLFIPLSIGGKDKGDMNRPYQKFYTKNFDLEEKTVVEILSKIEKETLKEESPLVDLIPDLRDKFKVSERKIVVAVGSTARSRVCSPYKMIKYLKEVHKEYPEDKIYLIGNGNLQKEYAKILLKLKEDIDFEDMVDKTTLKEAMQYVADSKLFIGFESGLYNLCYGLRKKGIILFRELNVPFHHKVLWLKILGPDEKDGEKDQNYPDEKINSISVEQFREALKNMS